METKKYVDHFKKTIIEYAIPYDEIVIAPYSNGSNSCIIMFEGINAADYIKCEDQSVKLMAKQVAKDLHVSYRGG